MCTTIGYGYPSCTLWSMIILLLMFVDNCLPLVTPRRMYTYQNGNTFFPPPSRLHLASANGDHSKDSPSSIVIDETKRASRSRTRSTTTRSTTTTTTTSSSSTSDDDMFTAPVCRIVSRADSRLPTSCSMLPPFLCQSPHLWDQLDAFYHAQARQRTKSLRYLERTTTTNNNNNNSNNRTEETRLLSTTRDALEDAGFELLSRRDLDLCESLNAAYLLRLSIVPDVKELDAGIAQEFYPERFHSNGTAMDTNELLFDGRVLVYWRGYSDEVTKGRLILPKLDYLQASLVQRSAAWLKQRLDEVESQFVKSILQQTRAWKRNVRAMIVAAVDSVPVQTFAQAIRDLFLDESEMKPFMVGDDLEEEEDGGNDSSSSSSSKKSGRFKLGRYGGSKIRFAGSPNPSDALNPFMICEMNYKDPVPCPNGHDGYIQQLGWNSEQDTISNAVHDMYEEVNHQAFTCEYDAKMVSKNQELPRMQLLERVTLSNLVDVFTTSGRRTLLKAIFSESELLEPRYEEVRYLSL